MTADYVIGVDLGTSEVKATLFTADGKALADAMRPMPLHQPGPGLAEQDADEFYTAALAVVREVVERAAIAPNRVAAMAASGQMAGAVGIDERWQAVTPWYPSALDNRYQPYAAEMRRQVGSLLWAQNGATPFLAPRLLWWRREQPDTFRRIRKVVLLSTYVLGKMAALSVADAFVDPTYLCYTGVADTARRAWSDDLCRAFDIGPDLLPRVVPCTALIGRLGHEAAAACGLPAGLPLVAGAGDAAAALLGAAVVHPGQLVDIAGTFGALGACVDRFTADTEREMLVSYASPLPAVWYVETYISGSGLTHRWFRDQFGGEEKARATREGRDPYQLLDEIAAHIPPGSDGLFFIPHLLGRGCPADPTVRGAWVGFTWTHTRAHFYRALLEAIAYDYCETLDRIRAFYPDHTFGTVRVAGGGGGSALWNQIKADVLGQPYVRLERDDLTAWGCALIAGHAVGLFPDMAAAAQRLATERERFTPRPDVHAAYQPYARFYREMFGRLRRLYTGLAQLRAAAGEVGGTEHS